MLIFNPKRIFSLRSVANPNAFLRRIGFTSSIASRFLRAEQPLVNVHNLSKVCAALNCTPNDLFEWRPDKDAPLAEKHELRSLVRDGAPPPIAEMIKDLPVEKLADLQTMIDELRNS